MAGPKYTTPTPGEFERERGETQERGAEGLRAVGPSLPPNIPIGIAPPAPLQVVSAFETRPISAYDFAATDSAVIGLEASVPDLNVTVPAGYTAVLRTVRIEFTPNGIVNLDSTTANAFRMRLLRNGAPIPNNFVNLSGALDIFEWRTHQVFGQGETFGLQVIGSWAVPAADLLVRVNYFGVLIPTKGMPPEVEIASPAILTRSLREWTQEVQT